ncbi:MAG TPA: ABC transporter permease [Patescibacteria group bacterium]
MKNVITETYYLALRSLKETLRIPMSIIFPILIPLMQLLIFSQVFKNVSNLPGFTAGSYLDYQAPSIILMTVMFSAGNSAFAMILDLDTGFFDKLLLAPISRISILLGRISAEAIRIFAQTIFMAIIITVFIGVDNKSGVPGIVLMGILNSLFGVAYGGIFYFVALKTKNAQAAQAMFPITFPLLFFSTALMPKALLPDWVKTIVSANPVSYIIEAYRSLFTKGFESGPIIDAVTFSIIMGIVTLSLTWHAFKKLVK